MKLSLWPLLGFMNASRRQEVPLNALTGPSRDWLVGRKRYRRRAGSATVKNGLLEGKWGAKARRMVPARLPSLVDGFPTPMLLLTDEADNEATLCFRSTNPSGADTWRTFGEEFSATHYPGYASPGTGVPQHRVVPMVYENEWGGLTLHRLNTAEYRRHMAAGSRNFLQVNGQIILPGYKSAPTKINGRFNDETASGSEGFEAFPLGLTPPLQMPTCVAGTDLGATTPGQWKGSEAFFYTMFFENERGELSAPTLPRPPGSAWSGSGGFGYMQVDTTNPTHFFDAMIFSGIADGPPGTRWKRLARSTKVDIASTGPGALVQPSIVDMGFFARIPQGTTTYSDPNGNDLSLDFDPRIADAWKSGGLAWPPRAQLVGSFDGHVTLAKLRPNPYALIVAPWNDGALALPIDDADLYGATSYYAAVTPTALVLRSVSGGSVVATKTYTLAGKTVRNVADAVNADATTSSVTPTNLVFASGIAAIGKATNFFAGISIGSAVTNAKFPAGTVVTGFAYLPPGFPPTSFVLYTSHTSTAASAGGGEDVTFSTLVTGTTAPYGAQPVPGADADESADSLLRTYVSTTGTFGAADDTVAVTAGDDLYITPGMLLVHASFAAGTVVTSVDTTTHIVTVSPASNSATGSGGTVNFGYDTGDTTLGLLPGHIRMFGNAFPVCLPWSKTYLDQFDDDDHAAIFSVASPGYPQDGFNTWMVRNRRSSPDLFGKFVGLADLGPVELHFYAKGRMTLYNSRTGTTHVDEDYTKQVTSWTRGARSPYAICAGNGWVIFVSDDGVFACTAGQGEGLLSGRIFDPEAAIGQRGELEYAIGACIVASDSDTDDYKVSATVEGGVLFLNYYADADSVTWDRQLRYDFSAGHGRTGLEELFQADGSPYPWSAPLTLGLACSAKMSAADGAVHHYAAVDGNSGTTDGKVIEIDTGTTDDGALVRPVGYTGVHMPADLSEIQPTMVYAVSTKAGSGLTVSLTMEPERAPEDAKWDVLAIPTSAPDEFGRSVVWLEPDAALKRQAIAAKIWDDGSGECPEVTALEVDCALVASTTGKRQRP